MIRIDLPDLAPPARTPPKLAKRPAPCAGLFGWRKDADGATRAPSDGDDKRPSWSPAPAGVTRR